MKTPSLLYIHEVENRSVKEWSQRRTGFYDHKVPTRWYIKFPNGDGRRVYCTKKNSNRHFFFYNKKPVYIDSSRLLDWDGIPFTVDTRRRARDIMATDKEMEIMVKKTVTTVKEVTLDREKFLWLMSKAGFDVNSDTRITIDIPSGGDYSGMKLDIDRDVPVVVRWDTVEG